MTLFFLFQPTSIALRHPGRIFLGVIWVTPVGHIVALSSKNIEGLDHHATETTRVFVPTLTAVNDKRIAPSIIHRVPHLKGQMRVVALLDVICMRVRFEGLQCLCCIASQFVFPTIKHASVSLVTVVKLFHWRALFEVNPKAFCILKIKKIARHNIPSAGTARKQKGTHQNG